ncbi:hypothetical protein CRYUN_Cryun17cG0117600 [Craigia yunnanensis]
MEGRRVVGWAARDESGHLLPYSFTLRKTGLEDVVLNILYCGVDHTDLHQMRSEISPINYPLVPGFVVKIPEKLALEQAAPLLCAGVTAYSPLKQFYNPDKAIKAGILGLGGVGHLAVLIAKAMGHHITVISSSEKKKVEALEHLDADAFLGALTQQRWREQQVVSITFSTLFQLCILWNLTFRFSREEDIVNLSCNAGKKTLTGSFIGSMEETQEILDFWAEKGLTSMIEVVKMDYINKAFERMERNDVRYRFVLDVVGSYLE